jgi:hypothetical protein
LPARSSRFTSFSSSARSRWANDHEQIERVCQAEANAVLASFGEPRERHARQDVAQAERPCGQDQVRLHQHGGRQQEKRSDGHAHPDAEEDRERLVSTKPGLDQPQAELPHLGRRTRDAAAHPLEQLHGRLAARLVVRHRHGGPGHLPEPALDHSGPAGGDVQADRGDQQGGENESEERQQHDHATPRS